MPAATIEQLERMAQGNRSAEDEALALSRLDQAAAPDLGDQARQETQEREYGAAEGVATAVAASFLLGPVGGLVLGAAQYFGMQRERRDVLDAMARQDNARTQGYEVVRERIDELRGAPGMSGEDLDTLDSLEAELDYAYRLDDPAGMQNALGQLAVLSQANEAQRVAAEVQEAADRRALDTEQYSRHTGLLDRFDGETQPLRDTYERAQYMRELLARGSAADAVAVLGSMPLIVNPKAGATSEGEVAVWASLGNRVDKINAIIEKELGSGGLTETTRQEISDVVTSIVNQSGAGMQRRQLEYQTRARDAGLPERFVRRYNVTDAYPQIAAQEILRTNAQGRAGDDVVGRGLDFAADTARDVGESVREAGGRLVEPFEEAMSRGLRNQFGPRVGALPTN